MSPTLPLRLSIETKRKEHSAKRKDTDFSLHIFVSSPIHSSLDTRPFSLDHLIRSRQHVRRNRKADLLGGLQIDDELELRRLLHREISRLGAFQNLVHIRGSAAEQVGGVRAIVHESAGFRIVWLWVNRREPVLCRQVRKLCSL